MEKTDANVNAPLTIAGYNTLRANLSEAAQHSRALFMTHLAANGYALIVLAGMNDVMFFQQANQLKLPVIDATVSLAWFLPAIAVLSMLVFVYWQMYMRKMWILTSVVTAAAKELRSKQDYVPPGASFQLPWIAFFSTDDDRFLRHGALAFDAFQWALMPLTQLVCLTRTLRLGSNIEHWAQGLPWWPFFGILFTSSLILTWQLATAQRVLRRQHENSIRTASLPSFGWLREMAPRVLTRTAAIAACLWVLATARNYPLQLRFLKTDMDLSGVKLPLAALSQARLAYARLRYTTLWGADLTGARLAHADLTGADLRGSLLAQADLQRANLAGANFRQADLSRAKLRGAKFNGSFYSPSTSDRYAMPLSYPIALTPRDLHEALRDKSQWEGGFSGGLSVTLAEANLANADLSYSDLRSADFTKAHLENADLAGSDLANADLKGAILENARLCGTNLVGALNLTRQQISEARYSASTRFPAGLVPTFREGADCSEPVKRF